MQAQANQYHVEITETWVNLTRNGYEAVFQVDYDDKRFVAGHTFNDPTLYWEWHNMNARWHMESAEEFLVEEFWMHVQDDIASQIEDHEESKSITTPKGKKDARYHSEN